MRLAELTEMPGCTSMIVAWYPGNGRIELHYAKVKGFAACCVRHAPATKWDTSVRRSETENTTAWNDLRR